MSPTPEPRSPPPRLAPALLLSAAVLAFTPLVLVPSHVYLANRGAVVVFLAEVLGGTSILALGVTLGLAGVAALAGPAARRRLPVLFLGIATLLWIHGYWLVWSYDVLDGRAIPWGDHATRGAVDAGLWLVLLPLLWWQAPRLQPRVALLSCALLAIQAASLGVNLLRTKDSADDFGKHYYVEKQPAFDFSSDRNVILIVLDEYQSDIFAEAILPREEYRRHLTGFTYFPDTVAGANYTELAVPALLTGRIYSNRRPRGEFLRDVYLHHSLPVELRQEGWVVHLYPWRGFANEAIYYHETVASNFLRRPQPLADRVKDVARLVDLGLFRCLPQFLKPIVHNDANWWLTRLAARVPLPGRTVPVASLHEHAAGHTLDHLLAMLTLGQAPADLRFTAKAGPPVFKFYHLAGLHVPVKMRRDLSSGNFKYNRANFSEQAEAYARIMGAFLDELRRIGVYDRSMIIIAGDHGSGREQDLYVNPGPPTRTTGLDRTAVRHNFQQDKARGIPLLLVKRFGDSGDIRTSRAPASLVDIPATIRAALGRQDSNQPALTGHEEFRGRPLFSLPEDEPRTRYYGAINWTGDKSDFVSSLILYRVAGFSWDDTSWSHDRTVTPASSGR